MEHEYASKGVAGSGLGLGIAGTALGLLNGGWGMAQATTATGGESTPVNRYEVTLMQEIASRDATIALKDAIADTDKKMVEVYTVLDRRDRELRDIIAAMKEAQNGVNLQQAVYNCRIACIILDNSDADSVQGTRAVWDDMKVRVDSLIGETRDKIERVERGR